MSVIFQHEKNWVQCCLEAQRFGLKYLNTDKISFFFSCFSSSQDLTVFVFSERLLIKERSGVEMRPQTMALNRQDEMVDE